MKLNLSDGIQLYHADCFDVFPTIADKSVDAIIADLPYGTTACKWDSVLPLDKLWVQYKRILKPAGCVVLFSSQPFTTDLINSNRNWFKYEWIWDKKMVTGVGQVKYKPMKCHENILIFYDSSPAYNPQFRDVSKPFGKLSNTKSKSVSLKSYDEVKYNTGVGYPKTIIEFPRPNNLTDGGQHPTQKPVPLMEYMVKTYTNEGDIVLDNTMGSGTTGVACLNTSRQFIGIEKEKEYFDIAVRRITDGNTQPTQTTKTDYF